MSEVAGDANGVIVVTESNVHYGELHTETLDRARCDSFVFLSVEGVTLVGENGQGYMSVDATARLAFTLSEARSLFLRLFDGCLDYAATVIAADADD